jgi:hypothetical protein
MSKILLERHTARFLNQKTVFFFKPFSDFNVDAETTTPCPSSTSRRLIIAPAIRRRRKEGSYMVVFGLIKVARDFVSETEPYTLFVGAPKYLSWTGMKGVTEKILYRVCV